MELIVSKDNKEVWFWEIENSYKFDVSFHSEPFVCAIISNAEVPVQTMKDIAKHLIATGCRYGVCFGQKCEVWEEALDHAYLETDPNYSPPAETLVLTTSHKNDSFEEFMYVAFHLTRFSDLNFKKASHSFNRP